MGAEESRGQKPCPLLMRTFNVDSGAALQTFCAVGYPLNPSLEQRTLNRFRHGQNEFFTLPGSCISRQHHYFFRSLYATPSEVLSCLKSERRKSDCRCNSSPAIQHCHYSVARFQKHQHMLLSPVTRESKSRIPALAETGPSPGSYGTGQKR